MKNILLIATTAALVSPAFGGDALLGSGSGSLGSDDNVGIKEQGTFGKILSTPGRALGIGDGLPPLLSEGTQEFGIAGNINFADDLAYNLDLSYGWFLKDNWEFGFQIGLQGVDSDLNFGLGLFTEYNFAFGDSKWVPFVGVSAEWASLDSDALSSDSVALGAEIGVKYFIRENIAISFSLGADFAFDDVFPGADDFQQQVNIGTRFYF